MEHREQVDQLVQSFAKAAVRIDGLKDPLDRQMGYAALHTDVEDIRSQLVTRGGLSKAETEPIDTWMASFHDGQLAINAVAKFDKTLNDQVEKATNEVVKWAWAGAAPNFLISVVVFIAGLVALIVNWGEQLGAGLAAAVLGGGAAVGYAVRAFQYSPKVVQAGGNAARATWQAASTLGSSSQAILRETVAPVVTQVSNDLGYANSGSAMFITGVRSRAKGIVGFSLGVLAAAGLLLGVGIIKGASQYFDCKSKPASYSFPTPAPANDKCAGT